jgi:5'-deoxynucleotidase YfbR-like HD superfamily hydrolase
MKTLPPKDFLYNSSYWDQPEVQQLWGGRRNIEDEVDEEEEEDVYDDEFYSILKEYSDDLDSEEQFYHPIDDSNDMQVGTYITDLDTIETLQSAPVGESLLDGEDHFSHFLEQEDFMDIE